MQKVVSWLNENKSSTCLEKTKLNLERCAYSDCVPLDEDGKLDDFKDGEYGYSVFYTIPKDELISSKIFNNIPDNCVEGELEFSVDSKGNQIGEVLVYTTVMTEEDLFENDDFEYYNEDISLLVKKFKNHKGI